MYGNTTHIVSQLLFCDWPGRRHACFTAPSIIYLLQLQMGFTRWQWYYNKIQQHTNNTHHPQTKHIIQNYTHNEGHTTHNEYDANTITTTIIKN
jgi:hypothetical protein